MDINFFMVNKLKLSGFTQLKLAKIEIKLMGTSQFKNSLSLNIIQKNFIVQPVNY